MMLDVARVDDRRHVRGAECCERVRVQDAVRIGNHSDHSHWMPLACSPTPGGRPSSLLLLRSVIMAGQKAMSLRRSRLRCSRGNDALVLLRLHVLLSLSACARAVGQRQRAAEREASRSSPLTAAFFAELAGNASSATIIDVGANDCTWGRVMATRARAVAPFASIDLLMLEPNPAHDAACRAVAEQHNGTFLAAAAWDAEDSASRLTLHLKKDSRAATVGLDGDRSAGARRTAVPTVHLARLLDSKLRHAHAHAHAHAPDGHAPPQHLALMHVDIEGAEVALLPSLLLSGALCRVTHLHFEWHLATLAAHDGVGGHGNAPTIAAAVGMRLALPTLLRRGCAASPHGRRGGPMLDAEDASAPKWNTLASAVASELLPNWPPKT